MTAAANSSRAKRSISSAAEREAAFDRLMDAIRGVAGLRVSASAEGRIHRLLEELRRELGLRSARGRARTVDRKLVLELRLAGKSYAEIARQVGCTPAAVRAICLEYAFNRE